MQIPAVKRLTVDNVPPEQQTTVETIANILNPFMDDVTRVLNGSISSDNTEAKFVKIDVKTNATGSLVGTLDILTGLKRAPIGNKIVDIRMTDNANMVPNITNTPFLLCRPVSATVVRVDKILNLIANSKYTITIEFL